MGKLSRFKKREYSQRYISGFRLFKRKKSLDNLTESAGYIFPDTVVDRAKIEYGINLSSQIRLGTG